MYDANYYRSEAKRLTDRAEQSHDAEAKAYLLLAAHTFESLAEIAERHAKEPKR
jgi:hypothetical protein